MFIVSFKAKKLRQVAAISLLAVLLVAGGLFIASKNAKQPVVGMQGVQYNAATDNQRIAFLAQFGWTVNSEPAEVKEIVIPDPFDETYLRYNELQKQQGLDLEPYCGQRVKAWTYAVTNYPGADQTNEVIHATMLICDGMVIGGDVRSTALDGFMHTFAMPADQSSKTSQSFISSSSAASATT